MWVIQSHDVDIMTFAEFFGYYSEDSLDAAVGVNGIAKETDFHFYLWSVWIKSLDLGLIWKTLMNILQKREGT